MKKIKIILLGFCCWSSLVVAQDIDYARYILDTLCSPAMHGRGYVEKGEKIAADFIAQEFEKLGLAKVGKSYQQQYSVSVNALPGKLEIQLDKQKLRPGFDYLVDPGSPNGKGRFSIMHISEDELLDEDALIPFIKAATGKFIGISPAKVELNKEQKKEIQGIISFIKYHENNPAAGTIIYTKDKLTWHGSTVQNLRPIITVKLDSLVQHKKIEFEIESKFEKKYKTQNVIGFIEGQKADSTILLTAHYDHLGHMGAATYFPGANDNASGVSILLNLAKHYAKTGNKPEYSMLFIAFGAEEIGLLGSKYYTEHPLLPLEKIKFLINLDISGTGDEGIQVVNGSVYKEQFDLMVKINKENEFLQQVKIRGESCNSDHCMFHKKGVPSFFIYTLGGIKAYHDVYDKAETLPFTEFENYYKLLVEFIGRL